ncbi:Uma2 family endonuclease [Nitrosophilus kaiyonis]|uniref:Uma2 family endonuclease n=1 Tax=Nitrosophilus kaiyonis TaxID=2930200 RepID=UPI0024917EEF|nr:Uma2 family endonuclease [Nitrosophilus kaiyonis]
MAALDLLEKYTYEDYKKWEGRWELIDGIAYSMSPAPYPKHQEIVLKIAKELDENLDCEGCKVYISPIDWVINDENVVQPDVLVTCENIDDETKFLTQTPKLIVEVLSLSTALKDLTTKFSLYEKQKVKYYVVINPTTEELEIFEIENDKYKMIKKFKSEGVFEFFWDNCKTKIDFKKVFK